MTVLVNIQFLMKPKLYFLGFPLLNGEIRRDSNPSWLEASWRNITIKVLSLGEIYITALVLRLCLFPNFLNVKNFEWSNNFKLYACVTTEINKLCERAIVVECIYIHYIICEYLHYLTKTDVYYLLLKLYYVKN